MIIVGIAVVFSITLFRKNAIDSKRDLLINECGNLAMDAMKYYKRPSSLGGGGNTFVGWAIPEVIATTATGYYYSAAIFQDSVLIVGTGNEVVNGNDSVKVQISVYQNNYKTQIIN
jgi:hypothetical protein